ncbi:MAG: reverse transcriptase-like protein [Candidatus Levybacteria bacterium]|nr:reverse transcriptase-like protein [Candidatus Levybacteria bacterium]
MKQASKLTIFGDGGSRGNPGPAAYGFAVFDEHGQLLYSEGKRLGVATNNVAEYSSVINALRYVISHHSEASVVHFKLDSLLIASQMAGKFKIKHPSMKELFITAKRLEEQLSAQIIYSQIPREQNKVADKLVNQALDFII